MTRAETSPLSYNPQIPCLLKWGVDMEKCRPRAERNEPGNRPLPLATLRFLLILAASLIAATHATAHPGIGIVMDHRGNVFYTDLSNVWKISPDGQKSIVVPNVHTHELFLDSNDILYGEHLWHEGGSTGHWLHFIWKRFPDGKLEKSPNTRAYPQDASFVRDSAGNMYWFTAGPPAAFIRRAPDGSIQRLGEWATYHDVRWIAATSHGDIFFTDDGNLCHLDSEGKVVTLARNIREAAGNWVGGIWFDARGRVYVAVWGARKVKRFDPTSRHVDVVALSKAPWGPSGGMVAPNGDLWLLETSETNSVRVRRVSSNGDERVF